MVWLHVCCRIDGLLYAGPECGKVVIAFDCILAAETGAGVVWGDR